MKVKRFDWKGAEETAADARVWTEESQTPVDVLEIEREVSEGGDDAVLALTARFDATKQPRTSLRVEPSELTDALAALKAPVREALEIAAANVRTVAEAQVDSGTRVVNLPQGQTVSVQEVPVEAAGIYAPGGRAAYPSSVLMCAIPAQVAGVQRVALASPPGPDGHLHSLILASAALCGIDEVYAMGGAQAIFALAYGTETIAAVNVIAGPGNAWVQEAKRHAYGFVGIDSFAGPSELMVVIGADTDPEWAALDLCAQAEHGSEGPLLVAAVDAGVLDSVATAVLDAASRRPDVGDAPLAMVRVPDVTDAIDLANAFAPEHLELLTDDAISLAGRVATAGCVFVGSHSATAFGDYAAGSNHVLPTSGAGRFSGPLGPHVFRRKIATVEVPPEAAAKLAPHVDTIARAEGFPVHGESAMIRAKS
jgi:histidinol dehydrogenase